MCFGDCTGSVLEKGRRFGNASQADFMNNMDERKLVDAACKLRLVSKVPEKGDSGV